jgi:hypothetical protein
VFEVVGDQLLCACRRLEPAEMMQLFGTAITFRQQVPAVVSSLYPRG